MRAIIIIVVLAATNVLLIVNNAVQRSHSQELMEDFRQMHSAFCSMEHSRNVTVVKLGRPDLVLREAEGCANGESTIKK